MLSYAIGVDLGGTNLRIAAVDEGGRMLEKLSTGTDLMGGRDVVIEEMTQAIRLLLEKFRGRGVSRGVGIGVPGIIDMDTGMLRESPNLPGWSEFPVHAEIERRLGIPVMLENDANAAALGEKWLGAGKNHESMCMLTLGTGVGGGIVLNGKIWHGMNGMAGELGTLTLSPRDIPATAGAAAASSSMHRRPPWCAWRVKPSPASSLKTWRARPKARNLTRVTFISSRSRAMPPRSRFFAAPGAHWALCWPTWSTASTFPSTSLEAEWRAHGMHSRPP